MFQDNQLSAHNSDPQCHDTKGDPVYSKWVLKLWTSIQINQPTRCNSFTSLLLDIYVWLNMFRALLRPSSGAYNCTRSLWFCRWSVAVWAGYLPDHDQQHSKRQAPTVKPEAPSAVVRSWWWAGEAPETCWATHKRHVINVWNCCIWLVDLFESWLGYCLLDWEIRGSIPCRRKYFLCSPQHPDRHWEPRIFMFHGLG